MARQQVTEQDALVAVAIVESTLQQSSELSFLQARFRHLLHSAAAHSFHSVLCLCRLVSHEMPRTLPIGHIALDVD